MLIFFLYSVAQSVELGGAGHHIADVQCPIPAPVPLPVPPSLHRRQQAALPSIQGTVHVYGTT